MTLLERVKSRPLPEHIAIVMDGNGRWAQARGLPRTAGHRAGADAAEWIIRFAAERIGLRHMTLFAFSAENWSRPAEEVAFLMELLEEFIREKRDEFIEGGIRLRIAGDLSGLPDRLAGVVRNVVQETEAGNGLQLTIALNYGGRQDLVRACARIVEDVGAGRLAVGDLTAKAIGSRLQTAGTPDPDLVVRTSGELRLSNFLLWQSAYAELAFVDTLWPEFTPAELLTVIADFQQRDRRYGRIAEDET